MDVVGGDGELEKADILVSENLTKTLPVVLTVSGKPQEESLVVATMGDVIAKPWNDVTVSPWHSANSIGTRDPKSSHYFSYASIL